MKTKTNANNSIQPMIKPPCLGVLAGAAVLALAIQTTTAQTTVYRETFGGNSSTDLNGTSLDVASGYAGGAAGATWQAGGNWNKDGVYSYDLSPGSYSGGCALLPFTPLSGYTYTLSIDNPVIYTAGNKTAWNGVGFTSGTPSDWTDSAATAASTSEWPNPVYWGLLRYGGPSTDASFSGPSTAGGVGSTTVDAGHLAITLDTSAADWTVTWSFDNGASTRTETILAADIPTINYVGINATASSSWGGHAGQAVGNFLLTATPVPEPASLAVIGLGALALVARRRRN
jgi:hypothetical protein